VKAAPKNTVIWPLSLFVQYACTCPDPETLPWLELEGLAAANFIVFIPCRPIALIRLDVQRARVRRSDNAVIVPAQEKTDTVKSRTELVFRASSNRRTSTRYYYDILSKRAQRLGVTDALFCSESGKTYKRSDSICNALKYLLEHGMRVFGYTAYSFRHSMIQALFDAGLNEMQVNAYTGHSNRSHTAADYYYHLDKVWAGEKIRGTDRVPLTRDAQRVILAEGSEE
jgi:integrase